MNKTPAKPIRCLIIQLTRLGDTLQSLMALRAAQQLYPQLEIHFVVRERFAEAAKRVPWLKSVVTFPSDEILTPVLNGNGSEKEALQKIAGWVRPLVQEPWDLVLNWSYSEASSYLTGLIPARVKLGYTRGTDVGLSNRDGWSHYIQAVVQGGIHQNIHLTDVLTTQLLTALQIHAGEPADNGDAPVTSKSFFNLSASVKVDQDLGNRWRDRSKKWIAIQLGAGKEEKTWEPENWAYLISNIIKNHPEYGVFLLGGTEDQERANRLILTLQRQGAHAGSILSLVGRSDFDLWASAVSRSQWLIAADTAAVHLASVLGTRVLNLSFGGVRWNETGPYGNGHYVVASNLPCEACEVPNSAAKHVCKSQLTPDLVYATWSYAIQDSVFRRQLTFEQHMQKQGLGARSRDVRAFRSRIRGGSDGGGVVYEAISPHALKLNDWTSMVMGHIARAWYCGWVPPLGQELTRNAITPQLIQSLRQLQEAAEVLSKICDEATRTAIHLNRHSSKLKSQKIMRIRDREQIQEMSQKLQELDSLIERLGQTQPSLAAFSQMSKVLMHNLMGEQISDLGRETAECYRQLLEGVGILREWIKFTINLARPVALRSEPLALVSPPVPPLN
ncbi:MAG: glycosyltransferase family 9 protein [Bdellovibrionia bacterium]